MDKYKEISAVDFDQVLSAFENASLDAATRKQACKLTASLFPAFDDSGKNDNAIDAFNLEQYGYYRSLGLSVSDTAYSIHTSSAKLHSLLSGDGLSFEKFVELIKQELFSRAECKAQLLRDVKEATGSKQWRTSLTLLEKLYPEEYGQRGGIEDKIDKLAEREWVINIVDPQVPAEETTLIQED